MSVEVASRELRNNTGELLRRVQSGEEIVITLRGKPVARLEPIRDDLPHWTPKAKVIEMLEDFQADPGLGDLLRDLDQSTDDDGLF